MQKRDCIENWLRNLFKYIVMNHNITNDKILIGLIGIFGMMVMQVQDLYKKLKCSFIIDL
ncbi:hypothetical protein A8F95_18215 [Bacillus wudalianchiensis]|uniref:Uncharacterized protein n=1 Tax=Pseudobacillus wudalianchiensis TaxID=1743143 RepID=A0A1B9B7Q4_9BACI|nr:hypothetical protein A8F95_18215 [Bacillus wudalianchiensis]